MKRFISFTIKDYTESGNCDKTARSIMQSICTKLWN